jgi:hypothetical protein
VPPFEGELAGGEVFVTGSSTVEPISIRVGELAAELSGGDLAVTVEGPMGEVEPGHVHPGEKHPLHDLLRR